MKYKNKNRIRKIVRSITINRVCRIRQMADKSFPSYSQNVDNDYAINNDDRIRQMADKSIPSYSLVRLE